MKEQKAAKMLIIYNSDVLPFIWNVQHIPDSLLQRGKDFVPNISITASQSARCII